MIQPVIIKSNKYGINLKLDPEMDFDTLIKEIKTKFVESARFFKDAKFAISFEGRILSDDEKAEIIDIIHNNTDIEIVCIMESNTSEEALMGEAVTYTLNHIEKPINTEKEIKVGITSNDNAYEVASIYRGTLRNGQSIDSDASLVVVGDVNPGASIQSDGNIIVLGSLKGTAFAGKKGDENCFVYAMDMKPMQIRIGQAIGRSADSGLLSGLKNRKKMKDKKEAFDPQIATAQNGMILIEKASGQLFDKI